MTRLTLRLAVGLLAALVVLSASPALGAQSEGVDGAVDLDAMVELYNANLGDAPGIAKGELAGKTVELRVGSGSTVATSSTGTVYHFTTNDEGEITDYGDAAGDSPNVRVLTSEAAMDRILASEDPAAAFDAAYENGDITVSGVTLTDSIRIELVKFGVWLGKLFGVL
ncbi:hypothetical protein [Halorarius litoreus]|uniref:hypothetical protein n=1 Tax=Halorarius litoreus TaxID=2962676 RepID=UPI0020CE6448|nr:hypothetical protein [Halorarius litoreus]